MHFRTASAVAIFIAFSFGCALTSTAIAAPPEPEIWADVKNAGGWRWHGRLEAKGDKLTLTESEGTVREIDVEALSLVEFAEPPRSAAAKPLADGALPPPWKSGPVGDLPRGGSAIVKEGRVVIETSAPDHGNPFGSFFAAYRPLPAGEAHITARVSQVESYKEGSRAGIILRDGEGMDAASVFLAQAHHKPVSMVYWDDPKQWNGASSGDASVYSSEIIRHATPGQSAEIDVDVTGARKLFLVAQDAGDGIVSDWADWVEPRILVKGVEKKLTDLEWVFASADFGVVRNGKNALGGDLKIAGKSFADGIGAHANSMIEYDLPPGTTRFKARCGIDQAGGVKLASIRFMVFTERPKVPIPKIRPDAPGLMRHQDTRVDKFPRQWLRLVRKAGRITGFISSDGAYWREIWSVEDKMKGPVFAGLAAQGRRPEGRWTAAFESVEVGTAEELGSPRTTDPEITFVDGTIFHSPIESATGKLLRLGGAHAGRSIPLFTIARIRFYTSSKPELEEILKGRRTGVALSNGDFYESELTAIEDGKLTARSILFGARSFDIQNGVDALVLRPFSEPDSPPRGQDYALETWRGGRHYAKDIRIDGGKFVIESSRLGTLRFPLNSIRRLSKVGG